MTDDKNDAALALESVPAGAVTEATPAPEPGSNPEQYKGKSTRDTIRGSIEELRAAEEAPKAPRRPRKERPDTPQKAEGSPQTGETADPGATAVKVESKPESTTEAEDNAIRSDDGKTSGNQAPAAWRKEAREQWDAIPEPVRTSVLAREREATQEAEALKSRHSELERELEPYVQTIAVQGHTRGQVVKALFDWEMALRGPNQIQAFKALASTYGLDPSSLADDIPDIAGTQPGEFHPELANVMNTLGQRVSQFESQFAAEHQAAADKRLATWSSDKPHFAAVRQQMAHMISSELHMAQQGYHANRLIRNGEIDMDAAYQAAVWATPEIREQLLAEERTKMTSTAGQGGAVASARRAGASLRPGAPTSGQANGSSPALNRRESVRQSIERALAAR